MIDRLDTDREAAVRLCLIVILLPIAVGVAAFVGLIACGPSTQVGALILLTAAAGGVAQDCGRHFKRLRKSPAVIEAYDAVRAAKAAVASLDKKNRA